MSKDRKVEDYVEPEYITVVVSDPQTVNDERGEPQYTTYLVATDTTFPEYSSKKFSVRRRYNDFVWLRDHLEKKMEEKGKRLTIAQLPGDTFMSWLGPGRFEAEFIEQRVKGLCDFMKSAVNHPWARGEPGLQKFLENQDFDCKK